MESFVLCTPRLVGFAMGAGPASFRPRPREQCVQTVARPPLPPAWFLLEYPRMDDWLAHLALEHAQIQGLVGRLAALLRDGTDGPRRRQQFKGTLEALLPLLEAHFAREERELPAQRALDIFPKLAEHVARLDAQHAELLEAFRDAHDHVGDESDGDFAALLARALDAMRDHERQEVELFQDVEF